MIRVHFWGARGSITTPGRAHQYYGGNTPCVELVGFQPGAPGAAIEPDNPRLILDGGTGLTLLQNTLLAGPLGRGEGELHILLSHYHWDHLIGIPFFTPMFLPGNRIVFYGESIKDLQASIERLFTSNYSPHKGVQNVAADLEYRQIQLEGMMAAGFHVQATKTRHPGGALAFRLQYGSHGVVYATDHEVGDPEIDTNLVKLAQGANMCILDAQFTAEQRLRYDDWGHSSHLEAVALAIEAGVETAVLFHHDAQHDDRVLDRMALEATEAAAGTNTQILMGRDGLVVEIGRSKTV